MENPRVVYIVTDSVSVSLLGRLLEHSQERGFEVAVVANPGEMLERRAAEAGVVAIGVPMARTIRPMKDLGSLVRLVRTLWRIRPHVVFAATPKASLLGMIAAKACGVPIRILGQWGLRLESATGLLRCVLWLTEFVAASCATSVVYVSQSLRRVCEELGIGSKRKGTVLLEGSSKGVDIDRFRPTAERKKAGEELRQRLGIPRSAKVAGFVGRCTRDKGVEDLVQAFRRAKNEGVDLHLMMVGPLEENDRPSDRVLDEIERNPRIHYVGPLKEVVAAYFAMDFLVLPSYREGFPNVVLEAGAAGLPTIGYRSTGVCDAVVDGKTGTLIDRGDIDGLARALVGYAQNPELCEEEGLRALTRVVQKFSEEAVLTAILNYIEILLESHPATAYLVQRGLREPG